MTIFRSKLALAVFLASLGWSSSEAQDASFTYTETVGDFRTSCMEAGNRMRAEDCAVVVRANIDITVAINDVLGTPPEICPPSDVTDHQLTESLQRHIAANKIPADYSLGSAIQEALKKDYPCR
jgi:hypothetical protein